MRLHRLWMVLVVGLLFGVTGTGFAQSEGSVVANLSPKYATDWMNLLYSRIEAENVSAPEASRMFAYAGVTLYESLLGGMPDNVTLAGQIWHMPDLPLWETDVTYDWIVVMDGAMSTVLASLFDKPSKETLNAFTALRDSQMKEREAESGKAVVKTSLEFGETMGEAVVSWIADDGFTAAHQAAADYEIPNGENTWVMTTEGAKATEPYWGEVRPFGLDNSFTCAIYPDVAFDASDKSTFFKQAQEVYDINANLTDWQKETARYWSDAPGKSGTSAGHWMAIVGQLPEQMGLDLVRTAMAYAMIGMVEGDSFVSAWAVNYQVMQMRPETYIQQNIRLKWTPYIETPPFPEYPSGDALVSSAAAYVLTRMFGAQAFTDQTHVIFEHEKLERSYTTFNAAAYEAGISGLYAGTNFRSGVENGMQQGRCVGENLMKNIRLNPVLQGE